MQFLNWLKGLFNRKPAPPMEAFVWLLDEPRILEPDTVRRVVEQALDVKFPAEQGNEATEFVVGQPPTVVVKLAGHAMLVHSFPTPYLKDPRRAATAVGELRLRKILLEHRAWISVDLPFMHQGTRVRGQLSDLNDWVYLQGEEIIGGFTSKVLMKAQ